MEVYVTHRYPDGPFLTYDSIGLFIIDGIITIPIALLGFLIMPGTAISVSRWMTF